MNFKRVIVQRIAVSDRESFETRSDTLAGVIGVKGTLVMSYI